MSDETDDEGDGTEEAADEIDDPFVSLGEDGETDASADDADGDVDDIEDVDGVEREDPSLGADDEDPFDALGESETPDEAGDPFADLTDVPPEEDVFEDLSVEDAEEPPEAADEADLETVTGEETVIVPKSRYCQRCEFFDSPPNVRCMHPESEILELVDMDRFKVQNCPVVEQRTRAGMVSEDDLVFVDEGEESN